MEFDVLIVGAGAAGLSCALILGSALNKDFAIGKTTGIILHQKASHLQSAEINNALGIAKHTSGMDILKTGLLQLENTYPNIQRIEKEKVIEVEEMGGYFQVTTNKNIYESQKVVIAIGYTDLFRIKGLEKYVIPHQKSNPEKNRIQLKNIDHLVKPGLYVAGTLAGHRSQYAIACGSGAAVATDILTDWNDGVHTHIHDKLE